MSQYLKLLVAYVPKYHRGIQTTCYFLLQLSKGKQGSAISGVGERECIAFMREHPSRDPLGSEHVFLLLFLST